MKVEFTELETRILNILFGEIISDTLNIHKVYHRIGELQSKSKIMLLEALCAVAKDVEENVELVREDAYCNGYDDCKAEYHTKEHCAKVLMELKDAND